MHGGSPCTPATAASSTTSSFRGLFPK
jgi:hypothetical protein